MGKEATFPRKAGAKRIVIPGQTKKAVVICLFFFVLSAVYFSQQIFFIDENDNFMAAMTLVRAGDIYKAFYSQHMPVMYYLCAVFYLLGARTTILYRIYFALFSAALWTAMYFRHNKKFGKITMLLGPAVYLACLGHGEFTQTIVMADKLQAYGMAILLFEFLAFTEDYNLKNQLSLSSCCWISFAVFISFGSAFVAAYGIFMVFLGVVLIELRGCVKQRCKGAVSLMAKKYWRLILIVAAPFAVLLGWYLISGNLRNFIEQAYFLNTKVYSKYLDGYGSDAIGAFFFCFTSYWSTLVSTIDSLFTNTFDSIWRLIQLLTIFGAAFYWGRRDKLRGIMVFLIIVYSAPRGYFNFHAVAQYLLCSYMFAFLASRLFAAVPLRPGVLNFAVRLGGVAICALMLVPLFLNVGKLQEIPGMLRRNISSEAEDIRTIVDHGGTYALLSCVKDSAIEADRAPLRTGASVPWFAEVFWERDMEVFRSELPTAVVCDMNYNVWGYVFSDFSSEIASYVKENYTNLYGDLWIRNEELSDVCKLLGRDRPQTLILDKGNMFEPMPTMEEGGSVYTQFFSASSAETLDYVSVAFGTYVRENQGELTVGLYRAADDALLSETAADISTFADNQYGSIDLPNAALSAGEEYYLKFTVDYVGARDRLTIYRTADNTSTDTDYAIVNGEKTNYNLCVKLYGEVD